MTRLERAANDLQKAADENCLIVETETCVIGQEELATFNISFKRKKHFFTGVTEILSVDLKTRRIDLFNDFQNKGAVVLYGKHSVWYCEGFLSVDMTINGARDMLTATVQATDVLFIGRR